jgi:fructose-1,6-bisphosphatase
LKYFFCIYKKTIDQEESNKETIIRNEKFLKKCTKNNIIDILSTEEEEEVIQLVNSEPSMRDEWRELFTSLS